MNLVRARLDHHVDDGAGDVAELGRIVVRFDADLFHRIRTRLVGDGVVDRLVGVDAVDGEVVGLLQLAVDVGASASGQAVERGHQRLGDPGRIHRDERDVAGNRRQLFNLLAIRLDPDNRIFRLQHRAGGEDVDPFLDVADFHLEIDARCLRDRQRHLRLDAFEAGQPGRDDVFADRHARDDVIAGVVGDAGIRDVGGLVGCGDGHTWNRCTRRIGHEPGDGRQPRLSHRRGGQNEPGERDESHTPHDPAIAHASGVPFLLTAPRRP